MKKYPLIFILTITLFYVITTTFAENTKIITLKDGSVLNGKVIEFTDGIYTFETSNLGIVDIDESDVLSIGSPGAPVTSTQQTTGTNEAQKELLKQQVEEMQETILSDEEIAVELEKIVEDDEIKAMLADPTLMQDVMSFDQNTIQQNDSVQKLMNNPKMQKLMNKIQQKVPAQ